MNIIKSLLREMNDESETTRKMLKRVPEDKFDWKPHPKSMSLRQLAIHIAELPTWVTMALKTSELDFAANPYEQKEINSTTELVDYFEECLEDGSKNLETASADDLLPDWTLRNGNDIYVVQTKGEVIRMTFSQIVHHRAQLGVYLRLLDIPIPGSYGPSADENEFAPDLEMGKFA